MLRLRFTVLLTSSLMNALNRARPTFDFGGALRFDGGANLVEGTLFDEVTATLTFGSSGPPC